MPGAPSCSTGPWSTFVATVLPNFRCGRWPRRSVRVPRVLLYYFGSKEALVVEIVRRGRARQRAMMMELKPRNLSPREVARALWREWSKPEWEPLTRLSFEVYTLALSDPSRFPGFLESSIDEWLEAMRGCTKRRPRC